MKILQKCLLLELRVMVRKLEIKGEWKDLKDIFDKWIIHNNCLYIVFIHYLKGGGVLPFWITEISPKFM
jgi:hypothetical protein